MTFQSFRVFPHSFRTRALKRPLPSQCFCDLSSSKIIKRYPSSEFQSDFSHHDCHIARLNHGSFGAVPAPVIHAEQDFRQRWRANPDAFYFGQMLDLELNSSCQEVAKVLCSNHDSNPNNSSAAAAAAAASTTVHEETTVALVENATVAATTIARRWASQNPNGPIVMCLDVAYKAVELGLRHICGTENVHVAHVVRFEDAMKLSTPTKSYQQTTPSSSSRPELTDDAILQRLDQELYRIRPTYVMLEHMSSQPSLRLPVKEMVELCRSHEACHIQEIAVDGAHSIGMLDFNVLDINADFYFTNLHKWAFASGPVCALHVRKDDEPKDEMSSSDGPWSRRTMPHAIPSWNIGNGIVSESNWTGTRDYAAAGSVSTALHYLQQWRSVDELDSMTFNRIGYQQAADELREAWKVNDPYDPAAMSLNYFSEAMGMIRLPPTLLVGDAKPGQPSGGVRQVLQEKYGIEAAIGNFGKAGAFIRLSHAVYTTC